MTSLAARRLDQTTRTLLQLTRRVHRDYRIVAEGVAAYAEIRSDRALSNADLLVTRFENLLAEWEDQYWLTRSRFVRDGHEATSPTAALLEWYLPWVRDMLLPAMEQATRRLRRTLVEP